MQNVFAKLYILGLFVLQPIVLYATPTYALAESARSVGKATTHSAVLPATTGQIDQAIAALEARLDDVRRKASSQKTGDSTTTSHLAATPDELAQAQQFLQQWGLALDQHGRHLRMLKEVRRLNEERRAEEESWRGFAQAPSILETEQLIDTISARQLELRTAQMFLSIVEGEIARHAARLGESHKQLRLASDQPEESGVQDLRRHWMIQFTERKVQSEEASVEAAEIGRLVTWEALNGLSRNLQFLERKISAARAQVRINRSDIDGVIAQINATRSALHKELKDAIAADGQLRASLETDHGKNSERENASGVTASLPGQVRNARLETSGHKVELFRGFLQLTDWTESIWEDRFWATEPRTLEQVRAKQRHYGEILEKVRQWKKLIEQSLSSVSDQVLRHALRADDSRLTLTERATAREICATLQERAAMDLRAVGALAFTKDLAVRLHTELTGLVARSSLRQKLRSAGQDFGAVLYRLWKIELYIAEDSIIAGGQKIAIPRSITLGKVLIALTIFLIGLFAARCAFRLTTRFVTERPAKAVAALVTIVSLVVAMTSVRIPWTVFAFMGGALAIGVGFGAQTLVNNFISGIILQGEQSIRVGDIVELDDKRGKVMRMGFRHSLIARGDGSEVLVPNSQFLEKRVVNWTLTDNLVRYNLSVTVVYGEPADKVSRLIAQAASEHSHVVPHPAPQVLLDDFGDKGMIFTLKFWMRLCPSSDGGLVRSDLRHRINTLFREAGIIVSSSNPHSSHGICSQSHTILRHNDCNLGGAGPRDQLYTSS